MTRKKRIWVEVDSIPKDFKPEDSLLIPDHKFVRREAWIKYDLKRKRKMKN